MDVRELTLTPPKGAAKAALDKPFLILQHGHSSAQGLASAFDTIRVGKKGTSTDAEQDLLRSMLVLTAAGIDSILKQLIRDTVPTLVDKDDKVLEGIEAFTRRQVRTPGIGGDPNAAKFLSSVLISESPRARIIEHYVEDLTSHSLQSAEEFMKAIYALGVEPSEIECDVGKLKAVFDIRNKIIHELDIQFGAVNRSRNSRSREDMVEYTNFLLSLGEQILSKVAAKLQ